MEILIMISPVVAFFGALGWLSMHKAIKPLFWITLGGVGLLSGFWGIQMMEAPGWEGLGYLFLLICGSAPAALSLLIGAGIGLITYHRAAGTGLGAIPS